MNLSIVPKGFDVLRKGEALAARWKLIGAGATAGIGGTALFSDSAADLALSINAFAQALGYDLHITEPVARGIGVCAAWAVGLFFTVATTDKLGLPAKPEPVSAADQVAP